MAKAGLFWKLEKKSMRIFGNDKKGERERGAQLHIGPFLVVSMLPFIQQKFYFQNHKIYEEKHK